ncbi:MAG: rRNA pseudouridine synthase [Clostridia bacterium]|nr:rRNA pseudouridine synthase [Clostridia bacterium]
MQRLDKLIASQGTLSRSETVRLIRSGQVTVDGAVCRDPSVKYQESCRITVAGQELNYQQYVYIMLNKPAGILCVSRDPKVPTVVDLLPADMRRKNLFPAGRLDKDSVGLVLLTDDGDFAHRILSPKNDMVKRYHVRVDAPLTDEHCRAFAKGITLADGTPCKPAVMTVLENGDEPLAEVRITEGRYHQVKRMFGVLDRGVNLLKRVAIGEVQLDPSLKEGECRYLTDAERHSLGITE